jgi:GT2 family glycosyltransferase
VRQQTYPRWELILSDDGSTSSQTLSTLSQLETCDERIKTIRSESNGGISAASNRALAQAEGDYVAFLDHDDELDSYALDACVRLLNRGYENDVIYTDEDKVDVNGVRGEPFYKPGWSPEFFRGVMYVGHLLFARRTLVEEVGGFNSEFDGVQDFELMLRMSERTDRIEHLPQVLYHWRKLPESIASALDAKPRITELQAAAVNGHLERVALAAVAEPHCGFPHRVVLRPKARSRWPTVSIVIPTKDAPDLISRCLESIFTRTTYREFEVVIVDTGTTDPTARQILRESPIRTVECEGHFNFSRAVNAGVATAEGDFVLLLNNDTEVVSSDWIETLVWHCELPQVGAVGPLLVYPDGTVQHAGVVLGIRGTADHIMRGFPADVDGYAGSLSCTREVSALTAACMLVPRRLYDAVGGLEEHYATQYQDVDLCLRLRRDGYRLLFTPRATLVHHESATRGGTYDRIDRALLLDVWQEVIARGDPYYSPHLSLDEHYRPLVHAA